MDAKKGKLTLKENPSGKSPDFNELVPKYNSNHTINVKVSELLTAAESLTTFLRIEAASYHLSERMDAFL